MGEPERWVFLLKQMDLALEQRLREIEMSKHKEKKKKDKKKKKK